MNSKHKVWKCKTRKGFLRAVKKAKKLGWILFTEANISSPQKEICRFYSRTELARIIKKYGKHCVRCKKILKSPEGWHYPFCNKCRELIWEKELASGMGWGTRATRKVAFGLGSDDK